MASHYGRVVELNVNDLAHDLLRPEGFNQPGSNRHSATGVKRVVSRVKGTPKGASTTESRASWPPLTARVAKLPVSWGRKRSGWAGEDLLLDFGGVHGEALEVVVAVVLDALDAQGGAGGEVLLEGDGADVGEVFAGEEEGLAGVVGGVWRGGRRWRRPWRCPCSS